MISAMTPEDELCLLLSRGDLTSGEETRARELVASLLRWPLILERAYTHQIYPLLYRNLRQLGFPNVPDEVQVELKGAYRRNALRNRLLAEELARLLRLLGDAKISAIPLKSMVLAEALYEDPVLRVCADIDILVPAHNVVAAHNLILSSGYSSQIAHPFFLNLLARYGKDCELMREDRLCTYPLDLHCGLLWGGRLERNLLKDIWRDAVPKTFYGVEAFALTPDWEFLYLATHAARHGRLKWFVDLDRFCSRNPLDWTAIKEKAERLRWETVIRDSLWVCAQLFNTAIDIDPAFALTPSRRRPRPLDSSGLEVPEGVFFLLRLLPTPIQKLRFLAIRLLIPTPADSRFLALPSSLTFLYYLLRPFRVAAKTVAWSVQAGVNLLRQFV